MIYTRPVTHPALGFQALMPHSLSAFHRNGSCEPPFEIHKPARDARGSRGSQERDILSIRRRLFSKFFLYTDLTIKDRPEKQELQEKLKDMRVFINRL